MHAWQGCTWAKRTQEIFKFFSRLRDLFSALKDDVGWKSFDFCQNYFRSCLHFKPCETTLIRKILFSLVKYGLINFFKPCSHFAGGIWQRWSHSDSTSNFFRSNYAREIVLWRNLILTSSFLKCFRLHQNGKPGFSNYFSLMSVSDSKVLTRFLCLYRLLKQCKHLKLLDISFCSRLSKELVRELSSMYPNVSIKRSFVTEELEWRVTWTHIVTQRTLVPMVAVPPAL